MTERRRALTLPFNVDKEKLMENPLRIPMTCLSSDCGRFERQVPWTTIAGCKLRHSSQKNVSMLFEHNHSVMCGMASRKPCLILTDVLKTEPGKVYMERIKQNPSLGNGEQVASTREDSGRCREESPIRRETRSAQRETRNDKNKTVTPKSNQKTISLSAKRSRIRRRLQTADNDEDAEESKDIDEVIIGKDNGEDYKFAEVVDCGLSVSWDPAEDNGSCDEFSPNRIKDRWTDPANEVQQSLKRKRRDTGSQCNGTGSPKRHRESVLRLTGEDGREGGPAQSRICFEESGEDLDSETLDRSIVQFTVGADERTDVLLPIINPNLEVRDFIGTPRRSLSSSQDDTTKTSPSEPIVLSSDDEENSDVSRRCRPAAQTLASLEGTVIRGQSSQEAVAKQQEDSDMQDMQLLHVVLEGLPDSVPVSHIPTEDNSVMSVAFSSLHCGGYRGNANGDIMIEDQKIIIPLTDTSEQVEVMLALEREELRRYSVWEQEELEDRGLHCEDEELPPAVLLFCVSETAAAAIQWDLRKLCVQQDGTTDTGKASPFILLTLRDPLKGMEGALFRSLLDIDCLKNLGHEKFNSFVIHDIDGASDLEDIHSPTLSLDDSLELIRRTGLDPHLLSLFGLESTDPGTNTDQDSAYSDRDSTASPHIELEVESQKETELELETAPEDDTGMQPKPDEPDEDQKEQELEHPPEKSRKEPTPEYTLCHRRTKGSYSVSLCKADSSWTKYKHQGLARRLIQFPPPPLKGGITVTMEDLQCLDNGQFLNDVIIDFYLKYLLQNASDAVVERSHIFSSFFYKQLTRRDNASEGGTSDSCQRQRRHQRVKTWTRHVDIFKKDFLFVPVNQEAHWYLVVICFPGLEEPTFEDWTGPDSTGNSHSGTDKLQDQEEAQGSKSLNDKTETTSNRNDNLDTKTENSQEDSTKETLPGPVSITEQTYKKNTVCKRPCILIMDSLRLSLHERVFKLLREYLQSEWEARRGSSRDFGPDQMKSSYCKVPLQDNSSDCGLYLLQYVESFLKDPVVHFDLPLHLEHWFPRQQVRRKRDQIRDLVLNLYRHQNLDNNR